MGTANGRSTTLVFVISVLVVAAAVRLWQVSAGSPCAAAPLRLAALAVKTPFAAARLPEIRLAEAVPVVAQPAAMTPSRPPRIIRMKVTAYCACPSCCGASADGITASGKPVTANGGCFVAADTSLLPFGTRVSVPFYHDGRAVPVLDRGGTIKGDCLDVFFPTHQEARQWGVKYLLVTVLPASQE
jgi:3D (Asp-Asp-Asp) domain-containing protein